MKVGKAVGPDSIPVEIWKSLGDEGVEWLTNFFNVILKTATMPQKWRHNTIIPLYKNKGDVQNYNNYRGIKLLSPTIRGVHRSRTGPDRPGPKTKFKQVVGSKTRPVFDWPFS